MNIFFIFFFVGEWFFMKSVCNYCNQIIDVELKKVVFVFIGQEVFYICEYEEYNEVMVNVGILVNELEGQVQILFDFVDEKFFNLVKLVVIVLLEYFIVMLVDVVMGDECFMKDVDLYYKVLW